MKVEYKWKYPKIPLFKGSEAKKIMESNTDAFVKKVLSVYQTNIINESPVGATGDLKNNILQSQTSYKSGSIVANTKYASVIQYGRKPAPVAKSADQSLESWIRRSRAGQSYFSSLKSTYPKITVKQAIFLLKRKKKKKSTKANKFFTRGINKSNPVVSSLWVTYSKSLGNGLFR